MPRPIREDFPGAWHHVMNRGAARADIYRDDDDRMRFLSCLEAAASETTVEVHGYCLMRNHFHLLVRSGAGRLSDFLRVLSGRYVRTFNIRWVRDGPIFRGRAHTVLVTSDAQLVLTSRYIHLNPVVARLVDDASAWPWSSTGVYLGRRDGPNWLQTTEILGMFGSQGHGNDYVTYLADGVDAGTGHFYSRMGWD